MFGFFVLQHNAFPSKLLSFPTTMTTLFPLDVSFLFVPVIASVLQAILIRVLALISGCSLRVFPFCFGASHKFRLTIGGVETSSSFLPSSMFSSFRMFCCYRTPSIPMLQLFGVPRSGPFLTHHPVFQVRQATVPVPTF